MSDGRFRSAVNGFNRQDVANYIEGMSQRAKAVKDERDALEKKVMELEAQLSELDTRSDAGEEKFRDLESRMREQERELSSALASLRERDKSLALAESDKAELRAQLDGLRTASQDTEALSEHVTKLLKQNAAMAEELSACKEKLSAVSAEAEEYAIVKDRVLKLELNASRRAVEIEREAALRAEDMVRQAEDHTSRVNQEREEQVRRFRGDLNRISKETGYQANLIGDQLGQLLAALRESAEAIAVCADRFDTVDTGAKPETAGEPAPAEEGEPDPVPETDPEAASEGNEEPVTE